MSRMPIERRNSGSITALAAALAGVLVVLGVGFFFFTMIMGAQKETKNVIDAGTLNLGKRSLDDVSVMLSPAENQRCFMDITTDSTETVKTFGDGKINLRRVNRMWAEAMLYKINAAAAANDKSSAGNGESNAQSALSGAESVSNALANKLKNENNLHGFFTDLARQNNVRMIGNNAGIKEISGQNWQTSRMEEGKESNIVVGGNGSNNFFAPPGYTWEGDHVTATTRNPAPQGANGLFFLKGYKGLDIKGDTFWQVPFLYDEKPHLVSKTNFDKAKNASSGWSNPVPNAFSAEGLAAQQGKPSEKAISWVLTNPRQPFKMSIPHSFVHIKVETPKAKWYWFPFPGPPVKIGESDYGFIPDFQSRTGPGILCTVQANNNFAFGGDTAFRTIDQLIFDYPAGSTGRLEKHLVARCNEMIGKVGTTISASDMHTALSNQVNIGALASGITKDFYLYSPDGEHLKCVPEGLFLADAQWLGLTFKNKADGTEVDGIAETSSIGPPGFPPIIIPAPFCTPKPPPLCWSFYNKEVKWKPGTGFNGCLGDIRVIRETEVYNLGVCTPII